MLDFVKGEGVRIPHDPPFSSENVPMTPKTIATLLIISAFATGCTDSASAEGGSFWDGSFHERGHHRTRPSVITGGVVGVDGYGGVDGGGYGNGGASGNGKGFGDWYGISSGHNDCPLFRKRVMTPDGWQVQMVPVC
jgi:hypothetical protein